MIETLEARELMSVAPHPTVAAVAKPSAAIVMSAKPAAKPTVKPTAKPAPTPAVKAFPAYVPSVGPIKGTNVVGTWTGTMRIDGTTIDQPFSINFAFQRGVAASGTFNLGPTIGNQVVTSTLVFDLHNNLRALVATPKLSVGFTGAITGNGNILYGRFSFNNGTGWTTGMFTLTRG
jgi:hypothetical protein